MAFTEFQREWLEVAKRLELTVRVPYAVELGAATLEVPVLLEGFGASNGMLLVTDYATIADRVGLLVDQGYGYSCLSESSNGIDGDDSTRDMLRDWAWTGPGEPPTWYNGDVT